MDAADARLANWLQRLALPTPDPGGGAAAALVLAQAAALVRMVDQYLPAPTGGGIDELAEATALIGDDANASRDLIAAWHRTPVREGELHLAIDRATATSVRIIACADAVVQAAQSIRALAPQRLGADLLAAVAFAASAADVGLANALGNTRLRPHDAAGRSTTQQPMAWRATVSRIRDAHEAMRAEFGFGSL